MSDQFIGELRLVGFNFAPYQWALAQGQLLPISQNTALFSLLGTNFGGDGRATFGLPNMQGNVAIGQGTGPGLSDYVIGQQGGSATMTLLITEVPQHTHPFLTDSRAGDVPGPGGNALGSTTTANPIYYSGTGGTKTTMNPSFLTTYGSSQPHENMMPYLALNWVIAMVGVYPTRG